MLSIPGYSIQKRLGRGGMGSVLLAVHEATGVPVALKVPHADLGSSGLARLQREAAVLLEVESPHLPRLREVLEVEGRTILALELIEGEPLDARLEADLSPGERLELLRSVAPGLVEALRTLHGQGVLHRDIKPANVLLRPGHGAVLVDLGLAWKGDLPALTRTGATVGTLDYIAPEQLMGQELTASTDLYGLALVVHDVLLGREARRWGTPVGEATRRARESVWQDSPASRWIPAPLREWLAAALRPEPADRPEPRRHLERLAELAREVGPESGAAAAPGEDSALPPDLRARFEVVRELGEGGMGTVLRVVHRELDREVALKLMHDSGDPRHRERFRREAEALAAVRHPNVVEVHESGITEGGVPYLVMELVDGESLEARAGRVEDPTSILLQVADALDAVHAAGLLHRDVKPGNVLVDREGRALLADFGLVLDSTRPKVTRTGAMIGTLAFMAPELLRGEAATPATDWYALGVTLYGVLTGELPYRGDQLPLLLAGEQPEVPAVPDPAAQARFGPALRALLAVDPVRRPTSRVELDGLLAGSGAVERARASAPPPGASDSGASPLTTRPMALRDPGESDGGSPGGGAVRFLRSPRVVGPLLLLLGASLWWMTPDPEKPASPSGARQGPAAADPRGTEEVAAAARAEEEVDRALEALQGVLVDYPLSVHGWPSREEATYYADLVSLRFDRPFEAFLDAVLAWIGARPVPAIAGDFHSKAILPLRHVVRAYTKLERRLLDGGESLVRLFDTSSSSRGPPPPGWDPEAVTRRGESLRRTLEFFLCTVSARGLDRRADGAYLAHEGARGLGLMGSRPRITPESCRAFAASRPRRWTEALLSHAEGGGVEEDLWFAVWGTLSILEAVSDVGLMPPSLRLGNLQRLDLVLTKATNLRPEQRLELEAFLLEGAFRALLLHSDATQAKELHELVDALQKRFAVLAPKHPDTALIWIEEIRRQRDSFPYLDRSLFDSALESLHPLEQLLRSLQEEGAEG